VVKYVLIVGGVVSLAIFVVITVTSADSTDRDGRIRMPGEAALDLDAGKHTFYYEEAVETEEHEDFTPPQGIQIRVRGLRGAPDPELDLTISGSQVVTEGHTAEEIATIRLDEKGRYGITVGPPPRKAREPTITVGESTTDNFLEALKWFGVGAAATLLLAGLAAVARRAV
jgi:hypothetical protein